MENRVFMIYTQYCVKFILKDHKCCNHEIYGW